MDSPIRILILILSTFFGYQAIQVEFGPYDIGVLSEFKYIHIGLVIIFTIIAILIDASYFRRDKKLYQYSYSFVGLAIIVIVFFKIIQRNLIESSKTLLTVSHLRGARNVWTFDFKENQNFKLTEYNILGQTIYYGKYNRNNDTLVITHSNFDNNSQKLPNIGLIRNDTLFWLNADTMVIQRN